MKEDQDNDREGTNLLIIFLCAAFIAGIVCVATLFGKSEVQEAAQRERLLSPLNMTDWIQFYPQESYMPPVLILKAKTPEIVRICVEQPGPMRTLKTDCRTVGEVRKWMQERSGK